MGNCTLETSLGKWDSAPMKKEWHAPVGRRAPLIPHVSTRPKLVPEVNPGTKVEQTLHGLSEFSSPTCATILNEL